MGRLEQDYREALDALRFSGAGKERIMNGLMETGERPVKRKHYHPLRPALIAAVLCLALVGTAFAVPELLHLNMRVLEGTGISVNGHTVEVAVDFYPLDAFSQALCGLAARNPGYWRKEDEESLHQYFKTWEEAHDFMGLTLFRNPVLDSAEPGPTGTEPWEHHRGSQDPDKTHLMLLAGVTDDGELYAVQTNSSSVVDGVWVRTIETVYTERAEGTLYVNGHHEEILGDGRRARTGLMLGDGYEVTEEAYTTPNGLDVLIIQSVRPDPRKSTICSAYFLIHGAMFQVIVGSDGPNCELTNPEPEQAMAVLKNVLDGFTLE